LATKVLLVEDSTFLRLANERVLVKAGFEVYTAADGEEALAAANDNLPDIILLDMMIPKISGPDVLRKLKANPVTAQIRHRPNQLVTGVNAVKLMSDGAAAYFEKSSLTLDKGSDLLAATVGKVLIQVNQEKNVDIRSPELAAKKAAGQ
jgi:CheY-like chemotaxis protein